MIYSSLLFIFLHLVFWCRTFSTSSSMKSFLQHFSFLFQIPIRFVWIKYAQKQVDGNSYCSGLRWNRPDMFNLRGQWMAVFQPGVNLTFWACSPIRMHRKHLPSNTMWLYQSLCTVCVFTSCFCVFMLSCAVSGFLFCGGFYMISSPLPLYKWGRFAVAAHGGSVSVQLTMTLHYVTGNLAWLPPCYSWAHAGHSL